MKQLISSELFDYACYTIMKSGFFPEQVKRGDDDAILSVIFLRISDGKRIRLLPPASDRDRVYQGVNAGTQPISGLLNSEEFKNDDIPTYIPLAECQGDTRYWVLLVIKNRKCELYDSKSSAADYNRFNPLAYKKDYDLQPLRDFLKAKNLFLGSDSVFHAGLQSFRDLNSCGYMVNYILQCLVEGKTLKEIKDTSKFNYAKEVEENFANFASNNTALITDFIGKDNSSSPAEKKSFIQFLQMYKNNLAGEELIKNNKKKTVKKNEIGLWTRIFNSFPIEWPGYIFVDDLVVDNIAKLTGEITNLITIADLSREPIDLGADILEQIANADIQNVIKKLASASVYAACELLLNKENKLKAEVIASLNLDPLDANNEEIINNVIISYVSQIQIPLIFEVYKSQSNYDKKSALVTTSLMNVVNNKLNGLILEHREGIKNKINQQNEIRRLKMKEIADQEQARQKKIMEEEKEIADLEKEIVEDGKWIELEEIEINKLENEEKERETQAKKDQMKKDEETAKKAKLMLQSANASRLRNIPMANELLPLLNSVEELTLENKTPECLAFQNSLESLVENLNKDILKRDAKSRSECVEMKIAERTKQMLLDLKNETKPDKIKILEDYEEDCKKLKGLTHKYRRLIGAVCIAAVGFVLGAVIGAVIGMAVGLLTGPGAFVSAALGIILGGAFGTAAGFGLFKPRVSFATSKSFSDVIEKGMINYSK